MKIAAQLYTIREFLKTPEEISKSLKKIKEIGYDAIQVSGMGPIAPQDLKDIVDNEGLTICATHIGFDRLQNELDAVISEHKLWDCKYVGLGAMPEKYRKSKKEYLKFIKQISIIADDLKKNGLKFIYHNHNFEFMRFEKEIGLDLLIENTSKSIDFEIDTYWVQAGGGDPVEWIKKVKDRMKVVHFKDMAYDGRQAIMAEIGEGNLNWERIILTCKAIGVEWACVEQDVCQRDPFKSLEISINNLKQLGL